MALKDESILDCFLISLDICMTDSDIKKNKMEKIVYVEKGFPWHDLVLKMLDWPFLVAVIFLVSLWIFQQEIKGLLKKGKITIKWGDSSIEIAELPEKIDQDIDPIKERLEIIEAQLAAASKPKPKPTKVLQNTSVAVEKEPTISEPTNPKRVIYSQLSSKRYRYRSVIGLSKSTGIPEDQVDQIVKSDPRIGVTTNREGKVLYFSKDTKPHRRIRVRTLIPKDKN